MIKCLYCLLFRIISPNSNNSTAPQSLVFVSPKQSKQGNWLTSQRTGYSEKQLLNMNLTSPISNNKRQRLNADAAIESLNNSTNDPKKKVVKS